MEGLGEIFTCILLYWLISAIKLAQTSPGDHMMTWNLCLHCNELPQQQRSARFTVEHSENSINKQSSSDWLNSCHIVFLVDYPDCTFLQHTIDKRKTLHTGYLISFCFLRRNASVFDPDIPRTQLLCKLPSDFLVLPGLSLSSRWVVCTTTSSPFEWKGYGRRGRLCGAWSRPLKLCITTGNRYNYTKAKHVGELEVNRKKVTEGMKRKGRN